MLLHVLIVGVYTHTLGQGLQCFQDVVLRHWFYKVDYGDERQKSGKVNNNCPTTHGNYM